jgi:putative ABC transport system permease protein
MFKNYLKIALRNLIRQKTHSFINITGLAVGMACSILILLWVLEVLSFDKFNEKIDDIHVVRQTQYYADVEGGKRTSTPTPGPLAPALKESFPEIVNSARFFNPNDGYFYDAELWRKKIL